MDNCNLIFLDTFDLRRNFVLKIISVPYFDENCACEMKNNKRNLFNQIRTISEIFADSQSNAQNLTYLPGGFINFCNFNKISVPVNCCETSDKSIKKNWNQTNTQYN